MLSTYFKSYFKPRFSDSISENGLSRNNNFNAIRFIAAAGVLISHSFPIWGAIPDPLQLKMNGMSIAEVSVAVFFIMSGFLITQSWTVDPSPLRYLARRALRILPALYVIILLSTFVAGPLLTSLQPFEYWSSPMTWDYLKGFGVFWLQGSLPGVFEKNFYPLAFNGPFWSLRVEMACYLLLMMFGIVKIFQSRVLTAIIAAIATIAFLIVYADAEKYQTCSFLYMDIVSFTKLASFFLTGSAFFIWRKHIPRLPTIAFIMAIVLYYSSKQFYFPLIWHIFLPYIVLCWSLTPIIYVSNFGIHGDFSYGMYIYAWPVQQTIISYWGSHLSLLAFITICMSITLCFSYLSWHIIEKHALASKPRRHSMHSVLNNYA